MNPSTANMTAHLLVLVLLISQSLFMVEAQLTFSKSWVAGGGKRSSSSSASNDQSSSPSLSSSSTAPVSSSLYPSMTISNPYYNSYISSSQMIPEVLDQVLAAVQPVPSPYLSSSSSESNLEEALVDLTNRHKQLQELMVKTWTAILRVSLCVFVSYCSLLTWLLSFLFFVWTTGWSMFKTVQETGKPLIWWQNAGLKRNIFWEGMLSRKGF